MASTQVQTAAGAGTATTTATTNGGPAGKGPDYVLFDRSLTGFSEDTIQRTKAAQLKLEHFYKAAVDLAIERNNRSIYVYFRDSL